MRKVVILFLAFITAFCCNVKGQEVQSQASTIADLEQYVYFVRLSAITITAKPYSLAEQIIGGHSYTFIIPEEENVHATGFVTNDGRFVTARHVIEPWAYLTDEELDMMQDDDPLIIAAVCAYQGTGGTVDATYMIESSTGDRRELHFREFTVNRHRDEEVELTATDSDPYHIRRCLASNDYAYVKLPIRSNLVVNKSLSTSMSAGTLLEILGFPHGIGSDKNHIQPQYTYATTSNTGLYHGQIPVTGAQMEPGNSGGPVFCKYDGQYYVVGIVSSVWGRNSGIIIPMSMVNY